MSSYICGDQTIMAAAEGVARYLGEPDKAPMLYKLLRMENERATGGRYGEEIEHQPVDAGKRREYSDLEIIGSCDCLAYQIDVSDAFLLICDILRRAADRIRHEGEKEGKWHLPDERELDLYGDYVYLPHTYKTPSRTETVYDSPEKIPWGID